MLEQLKTLVNHQARGQPGEFVYSLTPDTRSAILLDLRYVLRDLERARELPLLLMLVQTVERNNTRIRFPAEVLAKLASEIVKIRDRLPAKSPLLELADGAHEYLRGAATLPMPGKRPSAIAPMRPAGLPEVPEVPQSASPPSIFGGPLREPAPEQAAAGGRAGGPTGAAAPAGGPARGAGVAPAGAGQAAPKPGAQPAGVAPAGAAPPGAVLRGAAPAGAPRGVAAAPRPGQPPASAAAAPLAPAAPAAEAEGAQSAAVSAQNLKSAAAKVEVNYVTTVELGDNALAGYFTYCLNLGEYDKIIDTLRARVESGPRVWAWNLLVTAMRLSSHPDFADTAARYHAWLYANHPETVLESSNKDDQRKFSMEKIAALERAELGEIDPL